ncbi:hypothetical protein M8J76_013075 [Diaphorina citri]|nr:hypothetical protein M8J76_013075 [Diaphorina citri]
MDRFEYCSFELSPDESPVLKHSNVRLYDGENKSQFQRGELILTSHRLFWQKDITLCLALSYIQNAVEEEKSMFNLTAGRKIILYLSKAVPGKNLGPSATSAYDYVKLSFREGIQNEFLDALKSTVDAKIWTVQNKSAQQTKLREIKTRTGIVGIERNIVEKQKETSSNINNAFKDLNQLMSMAKEMVEISKNISNKIINRQGEITEDETLQFKSYLLSLGIEDPVTRTSCKNEDDYYQALGNELITALIEPLTSAGGTMLLTDAYCRINRARGLELLSPEDLLNSCLALDKLSDSPIYLKTYSSGVKVLQLKSCEDASFVEKTYEIVSQNVFVTVEQFSRLASVSLVIAKHRLLLAETHGKLCRDQSIEGLRFYENKFLLEEN